MATAGGQEAGNLQAPCWVWLCVLAGQAPCPGKSPHVPEEQEGQLEGGGGGRGLGAALDAQR